MQTITYKDKTIHIVSTAHVSKDSVLEVKEAIETLHPEAVCIELDAGRAHSLTSSQKKDIDIKQIIKEKKTASFLVNLILSNYQKQIADDLDTEVGGEMKQAIESSKELSIPTYYIDRNIQITMKRIWNQFGLFKKINLGATLLSSLLSSEEVSAEEVEALKQSDLLLSAISELEENYPELTHVLLHERNYYMAEKIKALPYNNIVVVIGAAHAPGMIQAMEEEHSIRELEEVPEKKKNRWGGFIIPGILFALLIALTIKNPQMGLDQFLMWMLISSSMAALGAVITGSHPVTILVTFATTWLGILSPVLAVGFFAGLTEAYFRPPYQHEFEAIAVDMKSIRGWYRNRVLRILLIFFITSILSSIGTFISGKNIIKSLFR